MTDECYLLSEVSIEMCYMMSRFGQSGGVCFEQKGVSLNTNPIKPDFSHISLNMTHTAQHADAEIYLHLANTISLLCRPSYDSIKF
jgi:hypothetical protein